MDEKTLYKKLYFARASILNRYPFFGRLLFRVKFGFAQCTTAFTDMRRIVFDPLFAEKLNAEEIMYVMIHELLHCALKHCTRGFSKQKFIYNVACDIVVNSTILEMYSVDDIVIDGESMMHLAPDGKEGRIYSAEEVYSMLMKLTPKEFMNLYGDGNVLDNHNFWDELDDTTLEDLWNNHVQEVVKSCGVGTGIPNFLARYLKEVDHNPRTNWRQILHDFIQFDRSDYDFSQPDKRYSSEFILPSFCENIEGSKVEKLWFLVDTSGSVSDDALSVAYEEIKCATEQIGNLSGMLSFFDYTVSEPQEFESFEDILSIKAIGGGGTNFAAIFKKLKEYDEQGDLPNAIIIITDGYDKFPKEEAALGVPVIWIIVDSDVIPPWGAYAYIST
ncbi:MAG: hypothetical protein IJN56_05755 [Clostridia bacterium]|nr:hypothetical protein [Clostridia bacterium]